MKAKKRYFLLLLCLLVAFLVALAGLKLSENRFVRWKASRPRVVLEDFVGHPSYQEVKRSGTATCRMETCFNLTRYSSHPLCHVILDDFAILTNDPKIHILI